MHVLITGGAGFIGSHLADACLARGDAVTVLDDLSTGRIENLPEHPGLELLTASVCDRRSVERVAARCDLVLHFAAAVGVRRVRETPAAAMATNVLGTQVVLAAAAAADVPVVVASSSEVYGGATRVPFREDACVSIGPPDLLRSGYACAKALAECAAAAAAEEHGLRAIVVRLFNTVGPRQRSRYGMVLPTFVANALAGAPLVVFGDGTQTRCFAHVDEVVAAVLTLVERQCFGRVFNVGSDQEWRIVDVARRVVELVDSSSPIRFEPFDEVYPGFGAGVARRVPDLKALRDATGAAPERTLDEIVRDVRSRITGALPGRG